MPRSASLITPDTGAFNAASQETSDSGRPRPRRERFIGFGIFAVVTISVAGGAASLAASLLPFSLAQEQIARFGGMRASTSLIFNQDIFQGVVVRARIGGAVLVIAAVVLFLGRRWIHAYLSTVLGDIPALSADISRRARLFVFGERRMHLVGLVFVFFCGTLLRFAFLFQPIRYDEANTFVGYASVPLYIGLSKYLNNNNHLLNTLLTHVSFVLFGDELWAIRLPAFVAGVLIVPAAYFVARALYGKHVALITAGLVAGSSSLVEFSTNSRGYSLVCMIWLLVLAMAVYLRTNRRPVGFLIMGALAGLGFYAMPIMLYPFGIVMLWLLLLALWPAGAEKNERPRLRDVMSSGLVAGLATLILYSPVFVVSGVAAVIANDQLDPWRTASSLDVFTRLPGSIAVTWGLWNRDVPVVIQVALGLGFVTSVVLAPRLSPARVPLIVAVIGWPIAALLVQRVVPYERVWLFLLPLYLSMAVAGLGVFVSRLAAVRRHAQTFAVGTAVLSALLLGGIGLRSQSVYYSEETGTLRDAEGITVFLRERLQPGDRVLATETSEAPLYYYFRHLGVPFDYLVRQNSDLQALQGRLVVVVNESAMRHQTLDVVLSQAGWRTADGRTGTLLRRYDTATLYDLAPDELQPAGAA